LRPADVPGAVEWLGFGSQLARQLFWVGADRLFGPALVRLDGIPRSAGDLDAAWLTRALGATAPGTVVTCVESLGADSGTTTRERLRITVEGGGRGSSTRENLFVKRTPVHPVSRVFTTLLDLGRSEVDFYRLLGSGVPVRIPHVYWARRSARGGRFLMLMEDLGASGCQLPTASGGLDQRRARGVVAALARLHAAFWESPRFESDLAWLRSYENRPGRVFEWWLSARSDGPALAKFGALVPAAVRAQTHRIHAGRPLLEAHWARAPRTLIHGDPHAGNLFFDGDEVGLFDWQVVQVGPGLRDVSYFLVSSLDTEFRRTHERELLEHYLAVLAECGVSGLQMTDAWDQYRLFALYVWIAVAVAAAAATLQSREIVARAVARAGHALQDLAAFEALEALAEPRRRRGAP